MRAFTERFPNPNTNFHLPARRKDERGRRYCVAICWPLLFYHCHASLRCHLYRFHPHFSPVFSTSLNNGDISNPKSERKLSLDIASVIALARNEACMNPTVRALPMDKPFILLWEPTLGLPWQAYRDHGLMFSPFIRISLILLGVSIGSGLFYQSGFD